jgi:5S rRNA maturation endonuclease (ribonuclease M5)
MITKTGERYMLDLNKVKQIIFDDISVLLDDLDLEYMQVSDNIFMSCPIHEGSDNKQGVSISLTRHTWRCWTRGCHEDYQTDIFGFVKGVLDTESFSDALRYICRLYDVDGAKTKEGGKKEPVKDERFKHLMRAIRSKRDIVSPVESSTGPIETLSTSPYFERRGFKRSTLSHFGVKDCSDNMSPMRHRSIIPITFSGVRVGHIARSSKQWLTPKYLFSEGLRKTDYLYNYDNAVSMAQDKSCMFLVEGQGDVWRLHETGVQNTVGLFGKDISETQKLLLIRSGVTILVVLTDNDQAGRESKIKIKRDMGRLFNLVFPKMHTKDLGDMSIERVQEQILSDLKGCY